MYELACRRLGDRVRKALEVYRGGGGVMEVARALGLSAQSVKNRYGREKLVRLVQGAVLALVRGLQEPERQALLRHLRLEAGAGFTRREVAGLLQADFGEPEEGPVLEEDELLETLGWGGLTERNPKGHKAPGRIVVLRRRLKEYEGEVSSSLCQGKRPAC